MVNFAIKWNKKKNIRYATLQSAVGEALKAQYKVSAEVDSVVLIDNQKAYVYSSAALRASKYLGFPVNLFYAFLIVPTFIRNAIYKWIAKNRYKWFGKREQCMIPTKEVKSLFLE
jgi:predicted DCC family thiol-disulfide oxidoreductase YuxK